MKQKLLRILSLAACLGVVAFSMTGCLGTWALGHTIGGKVAGEIGRAAGEIGGEIGRAAGEMGGEIGNAAGNWGRVIGDRFERYGDRWEHHIDDWEDYADHWNDWSGAVGEGLLNTFPTPRELLSENVAVENRQLQTIPDEGISRISINITSFHNNTVVVVEKGGEDGYIGVEYDDAHFTVKRNALNGVAAISVRGKPRESDGYRQYQARIKLPARLFEQIRVRGEDMAVTLLDLDSPLDVVISDSALAAEGCTGPAELDVDDSAVSVLMPGSYADSFRLKGENSAATLAFQDKKPDNLSLNLKADDSAAAVSLDGVERYQSNYTLEEGDGSTKVALDFDNSAVTVGVRTEK